MGTLLTPSSSPSPSPSPSDLALAPSAPQDGRIAENSAAAPLLSGHASLPFDPLTRHLRTSSPGGTGGPDDSNAESSSARLQPEIEMDPLTPAGHRRRRSSLMNPVGGASGSGRSSRPRGQSIRSQAEGLEDSKILEEGNTDAGALRPHDRSDDSLSDEDLHDDEETGLTTKDKRRKKQKKRRNTLLDQRIVKESVTEEEKREADRNVLRRSLINVTLIGLWYFFSLSISIVSHPPIAPRTPQGDVSLLLPTTVQQMDVRLQ